jgi:glycine/D-amino acid oxidase-like deaminating enzyme
LSQPDDVTVNAAALTQALLDASDVTVHERTEVDGLEREGDDLRVVGQDRTVFCKAVVLAINGYAPLLEDHFTDLVAPVRSLVLVSEPLDVPVVVQPCSADYGYEFCRQLADRRLLVGSWRHPQASTSAEAQPGGPGDAVEEGLLRFAGHHFPEIGSGEIDRWSGTMGSTRDGLPLVGSLPHLPRVYFGVGLAGRGLSWAFVVAERVVELMLRDTDPGILSAARFD